MFIKNRQRIKVIINKKAPDFSEALFLVILAEQFWNHFMDNVNKLKKKKQLDLQISILLILTQIQIKNSTNSAKLFINLCIQD